MARPPRPRQCPARAKRRRQPPRSRGLDHYRRFPPARLTAARIGRAKSGALALGGGILSSLPARARLTAARIGHAKPGALALGGGIVALLVLLLVARAALAAPRGTSPSVAAVQSSPSPLPAPTATVTPTINVAPTQTRAAELAVLATLSVPTMTPRPTPSPTPSPIPSAIATLAPTPTATVTPIPTPTTAALRGSAVATQTVMAWAGDWGPVLVPLHQGKTYADPGGRFSLIVPQDWEQKPDPERAVLFLRPGGRGATFVYLESAQGETLGRITPLYERKWSGSPGYKQIRADRVVIDGQRAYRYLISYTSNGEEVLNQFVFFLANDVVHIIGASAYPADFGQLAPVFDGIAGAYNVGATRR